MVEKLNLLGWFCDAKSGLPKDASLAAWRFYSRMKDLFYIETGREVALAYALTTHGLMKELGGEFAFEIITPGAIAPDLEGEFIQSLCGAVGRWLDTHSQPQNEIEKDVTRVLDHNKWPQSYTQAVLRNSIVGAWSAFESMAADVWAAAVEADTESLLRNVLISHDIQKETFLQIRKALGVQIGEILARKMGMKTLPAIRAAYAIAFAPEQFDFLSEQDNTTLKRLEKTRHLIVHRGGVVDHEFLKASGVTAPLDQELEFSTATVHELVNAAIDAGLELLEFVRLWFWQRDNG